MMADRKRPWLEHYDYWVPPHQLPAPPSLRDPATVGGGRYDLTALSFLGADITFGTLKNHADRLAASLALRGIVKAIASA